MKKEIDIDKYNELCDKIRSSVLYAEAFRKRNENREKAIYELIKIINQDEIKLVDKVESLEKLVNRLCNEVNSENDS